MVCCSILAWFLYLPFDLEDYYSSLASVFTFSSNVHFYIHSGYFDPSSELNALLHTWSLTVEEQFYFVFPWILLLAFKVGRKAVWLGVIALMVISFCLSEWRIQDKPMASFYLLYARGWELLIGAFCAILVVDSQLLSKVSNTFKELLAWLGLAMILYGIFFFTESTPAAGRYTLIPTIGAALIILFSRTDGYVGRMLSHPLLIFVGLISYSTYLWHQPLLAFSKYYFVDDFNVSIAGVLCLLSFVLGYLTWRFIEKPFRYGSFGLTTQRRVYTSSVVLGASMIVFSIYGESEKGYPDRLDSNILATYQTPKNYEQIDTCFILKQDAFDLSDCFASMGAENNVLIVGDSHAASLFPSLRREFEKKNWNLSMLTYGSCVPFISESRLEKYKSSSSYLARHINTRCESVKESFRKGIGSESFDLVIVLNHYNNWMGTYRDYSFPEFWDMYVNTLIELFDKDKLLVLGSLPIWNDDLPKLIVKDYAHGKDFLGPSLDGLFDKNSSLDGLMSQDLKSQGISFFSSKDAFCSPEGCARTGIAESGDVHAVAYDGGHLSAVGSKILAKYIASSVKISSLMAKNRSIAEVR